MRGSYAAGAIGALLIALTTLARADSTPHGLSVAATSPLPVGSCLFFDQGPGTDVKACAGAGTYWSSLFGVAPAPTGAANAPLFNAGGGGFTNGTRSGNTTAVVTTTGAQTSGKCVTIDANGNHVADVNPCGGASGGGIITFTSGSSSFSSTNPFVGPGQASTTFGAVRPWVAPKTITISGMICFENGGPGAGNTLQLVPMISVGGGTATDNANQQVQLSGTTSTSSTVTDVGVTLNRGDAMVVHLTSFTGVANAAGLTCTFNWS